MPAPLIFLSALQHCFQTAEMILLDCGRFILLVTRSRRDLAAENLFLRKQRALFQERQVKPLRADDSIRWSMVALSR